MNQPAPIGCNRTAAMEYLGCTERMFDELTARRIVVPIKRNWYAYWQLDEAMKNLIAERGTIAQVDERDPEPLAESNTPKGRKIYGARRESKFGQTPRVLLT